METAFALDTTQFGLALTQYVEQSKKSLPDILNRTAADVAMRTGLAIEKAEAERIRRLTDKAWWVKYVAMRAKELGLPKGGSRKRGQWAAAVKLSKKIINVRVSHIGWIRAAWFRIADACRGTYGGGGRNKPGLTLVSGTAVRATAANLSVDMVAAYASMPGKPIENVEHRVWPKLQQAMDAKAADLMVYVERKLSEEAAKVSAGGGA